MIGQDPTPLLEHIQTAKRFAALSGPFAPSDAILAITDVEDTDALVAVAAHLASTCDTRQGDGTSWLMREPERHWILGEITKEGALKDAVAWRRDQLPTDETTLDLLDALEGVGMFSDAAIERRITAGGSRSDLERIAVALERAGPHAPAHDREEGVRASLTRLDVEARGQALLDRGFFGRDDELAVMDRWIANPVYSRPVTALFITGLPGIGKTTLLEEAVRRAIAADPQRAEVRLDFDRAGLDALDWIGLTLELARQVAAQVPEHAAALRQARLVAAGGDSPIGMTKGDLGRQRVPKELAETVATTLRSTGRSVLLILDTLEVLRGRGQTHPGRLFDWLDEMVSFGVAPISVLAAGRGDAFDGSPERVGSGINLPGLEEPDAVSLMTKLGIPEASFADVIELAEGNPLVIRLAARVIEQAGSKSLGQVERGKDLAAAYLYRILLSRIDDVTVAELAHPGLVVRRIDPSVISEVLGPELGFGVIEPERAGELFDILASHHWLVEDDPLTPGFVKHRSDIRTLLLRLLYKEDPKGCAKIDRAASKWFARRLEGWCAVEAAYHRLQLMRSTRTTPQLDPAVLLLLDDDTIEELPERAQDLVRRARGERSTKFRGIAPSRGSSVDPSAAIELQGVVERGDWIEGQYVYDQTFAVSMFDARSPDADVARAFLWRSGRWAEAKRLYDERHRLGADDVDIGSLAPVIALVRLEMWAEFRFDGLVTRIRRDPELLGRAAQLRQRGVTSDLGGGALGFALRRSGIDTAPPPSRSQDSVGTAYATWAPPLAQYGETRDGTALSRRRLEDMISGDSKLDTNTEQGAARLLAVDTPYAPAVAALVQARERTEADRPPEQPSLLRHLPTVDAQIARLGGLPPRSAGRWSLAHEDAPPGPQFAQERLAYLGLFAEWAGSAAFELRDPDLRLIAASAERWRRTTAGRWSYGRPPARSGNEWLRPVDVSIADRIDQLRESDDPGARALDQLAAWSITGDGEATRAAIQRRFRDTISGLAGGEAIEIAASLLRRSVPSAFVPPLAVLLSMDPRPRGKKS